MDEMTMCDVKGVIRTDQRSQNVHPTVQVPSDQV